MDKQSEILDRIKSIRKAKGITQLDISEQIGMAKNNYGKVENGRIELSVNRLYQIAEILDVEVSVLLGIEGDTSRESAANAEELKYLRGQKAVLDTLLLEFFQPIVGFFSRFNNKDVSTEQPNEGRIPVPNDFQEKLSEAIRGAREREKARSTEKISGDSVSD